jgi:hypothetical protein
MENLEASVELLESKTLMWGRDIYYALTVRLGPFRVSNILLRFDKFNDPVIHWPSREYTKNNKTTYYPSFEVIDKEVDQQIKEIIYKQWTAKSLSKVRRKDVREALENMSRESAEKRSKAIDPKTIEKVREAAEKMSKALKTLQKAGAKGR